MHAHVIRMIADDDRFGAESSPVGYSKEIAFGSMYVCYASLNVS